MKKHKITDKQNKNIKVPKSLIIIYAVVVGLNMASHALLKYSEKKREDYRQQYITNTIASAKVTNANDNFTQILWLNYLSTITKDENIALAIDECLNNLTEENFAKVNSLVESKNQYYNSIFSDIVTIENLEGYYVNYTDLGKRKVAAGKQIDVKESNCVNIGSSIYLEVDELLDILYNDYKGELRSITF